MIVVDEQGNIIPEEEQMNYTLVEHSGDKVIVRLLTEEEIAQNRIVELKQQLAKYKEDVEQVELFGMERNDYEEKKKKCAEIILELRQLEREVQNEH